MSVNPNDQDPRSTGEGVNTGVYGAPLGGPGLRPGTSKVADDARVDDKIDQDVDAISAASGADDETEARELRESRLGTDDGKAGRLDELS